MKNKLNIYYDEEGDFLEFRIGKPTPSVYNDIGNDIFQRIDERCHCQYHYILKARVFLF